MKIAVLIPTFRRPGLLINALDSLRNQSSSDFLIVVSDNDAEKTEGLTAASSWAEAAGLADRVHLTVAHLRGLSQNRNNGLAKAFGELGVDAVAMMDDDSEAHPDWVGKLREACAQGAGLIGGPTIYRFPDEAPLDVRNTLLFGVPFDATGFVPRLRSSNNCTITRQIFERSNGMLFNPAFGASGGEDTHLFITQRKSGVRTWWQNDAIVFEDVPLDRCTMAWVANRQRNTAVNAARIDRQLGRPGAAWLRQPYYAVREFGAGIGHLVRGGDRAVAAEYFRTASGRLQGLLGRLSLHDSAR